MRSDVADRAREERDRLAVAPTTRMPGRALADRAAVVEHLERHVVGEHHEEDQDDDAGSRRRPVRRCDARRRARAR